MAPPRSSAAGPLFHGGVRGLYPGNLLLPPNRTRAPSIAAVTSDGVCRTDRVYLTADLAVARLFAHLYPPRGGGWVYEVEPLGDLEPDPTLRTMLVDADPAQSFAVPEARVVRVAERNVREFNGRSFRQTLAEVDRRLLRQQLAGAAR